MPTVPFNGKKNAKLINEDESETAQHAMPEVAPI
jgi:hypothetical protein